ncbi:MAG: carotenoid biosynthesis protein, partial [Anaerolineales bacterium]
MFETQLNRLVKIHIPLTMAAIVLVSTIYHYLTTPIPASTPPATLFIYDILAALFVIPLLYHCLKVMGTTQGLLFFFTVSFFVGGLEALWVFLGKLGILGDAYDYSGGGVWFFGVPFYIAVGWFIWAYVFYFLARQLFPQASPLRVACLCGLMALCIDIWMDPSVVNSSLVTHSPNVWNWAQTTAPKIFTVPLYNFIGWFLSVATVVYVYEISWARIQAISQTDSHPFRWVFMRLIAGWIIFV